MRRLTTILIVGALVGAAATSALAQQGRTELRGTVTDETGGALPGVTVFIQNEADGTFREVITGGDGSYFAAQLLPGVFSVTAALPASPRSRPPATSCGSDRRCPSTSSSAWAPSRRR